MSARGRIIQVLAALIGLPLAALLLAIAAVALFGVSIDASRWRDALAARASVALGRQVALDGVLVFELGREAAVHVGGVRILNPPGFAAPELARLGEARVRIDLLAALRGRLQVHSIEAAAGRVRLERAADGRVNWAPPARAPGNARPASPGPALDAIEIQRASIRNVAFEYHDAGSGAHHLLDLEELVGIGKWNEPLKLTLRGHVGQSFPYTVELDGGSARLLQEGREPWPFTLDFVFLGTRLHASGTLDIAQGAARFDFGAGTEDFAQVERILQTKLPDLGAASLTGKAHVGATSVELSELHGVLGRSELNGKLAVSLGSGRRRVDGELAIAVLDLRPFLETAPGSGTPLTFEELMRQAPPVRDLVPFDADLALSIGTWIGLPVEVRDVRLALHGDARRVRAPITGTIAGVRLTGRIDLDKGTPTPSLGIELDAANLPLRGLGQLVPRAGGLDGDLGRVALRLGGRGETLGAMIDSLDLRLAIANARLRYASAARARPVDLTLDSVEVTLPQGMPLRGTARGSLLGRRATLTLRAGGLQQMLRESGMPIDFRLAAGAATARVDGRVAWGGTPRPIDLAFSFGARRVGDLAHWLGVDPQSDLPLEGRGRVRVDSAWRLETAAFRLGRTEVTLHAQRTVEAGEPVIAAALSSRLVDVPELRTLRRQPSDAAPRSLTDWLGIPILPQGVTLAAADIQVDLTRVALGRMDLTDVGLRARVRGGQLLPSPCTARFDGVPFDGMAGMDLRGTVPEVSLEISTGAVDVGRLLRNLGVAENLEAHAEASRMKLIGRGGTLDELLRGSSLELRLQGGSLTVRGRVRRAVTEIRLEETLVSIQPGKPIAVRLQGALDDTPAEVTVTTGTLADFARDTSRVPLSLEAQAAGARLALDGEVLLPLGQGGNLTLTLAGEELDSLSALAGAALPPWKSWSLAGPISQTADGYEIAQLTVQVGNSRLYGQGRLDLSSGRPRLDARLNAPEVQLDNFPFERRVVARQPVTPESMRATAGRTSARTQSLLSAAFLRRFDAHVDVEVAQVSSGGDALGYGMLRVQLVEGRLEVAPAEIMLPGGSARLSLAYDPTGDDVALAIRIAVERFDYKYLAKRLRPDSDASGLFSLKLDLTGRAPTLSTILAHANGRIDFAAWPRNMRSGVFNRWTVNLLFQLIPFVDPTPGSRINCVVVRVGMTDGKLANDSILIDTTRARVFGTGGADFATEEIGFRFRPRAKRPVLFSLQPPIDVTGTMTDFRIGVGQGTIPQTISRFFTSVFVVPFEMLTRGRLPADGADVCTDPLGSPVQR